MLVYNEQIFAKFGEDEAEVELADDVHTRKVTLLEDALQLE